MNEIIDKIHNQLDDAMYFAEHPLRNDLETGFRHSPLTDKEKLQRYEAACKYIAEDLKYVFEYIEELTFYLK